MYPKPSTYPTSGADPQPVSFVPTDKADAGPGRCAQVHTKSTGAICSHKKPVQMGQMLEHLYIYIYIYIYLYTNTNTHTHTHAGPFLRLLPCQRVSLALSLCLSRGSPPAGDAAARSRPPACLTLGLGSQEKCQRLGGLALQPLNHSISKQMWQMEILAVRWIWISIIKL